MDIEPIPTHFRTEYEDRSKVPWFRQKAVYVITFNDNPVFDGPAM